MNRNLLLVLVGVGIGACATGATSMVKTAAAVSPGNCDYTYIQDEYMPGVGAVGEIHYDGDWTKVLAAGFQLKAIAPGSYYIFERCK